MTYAHGRTLLDRKGGAKRRVLLGDLEVVASSIVKPCRACRLWSASILDLVETPTCVCV